MNVEEAFCNRPPEGSLVVPGTSYEGTVSLGVSSEGRMSRCLTPDQSQGQHEEDSDRSGDLFQHILKKPCRSCILWLHMFSESKINHLVPGSALAF